MKECLRDIGSPIPAFLYTFWPVGMSGRNAYATNNGYLNSNAPGRYGDLYTQDNVSSTSSLDGYGSSERRPGGYGGLGPEPNEEISSPFTSSTRYGVDEDGVHRVEPQDNRDPYYSESSRSKDTAAPRANGNFTANIYSRRRGQRSMEGESHSSLPR